MQKLRVACDTVRRSFIMRVGLSAQETELELQASFAEWYSLDTLNLKAFGDGVSVAIGDFQPMNASN